MASRRSAENVEIRDFTRRRPKAWASLPFAEIAGEVLPGWTISLVFVGEKRARDLNIKLRGKTYIPNVLSYRLDAAVPDGADAKSGEIIICPTEASKQAPAFFLTPSDYCLYLFIHGVLHIKGWAHGARMEACEKKLLTRYAAKNSRRNRHRHLPDQGGGR